MRKISELSKPKKSNRLSIIKEDEIEEDRRNSTTQLENMEHNRNNKLINKIKTVNLFKNNLDSIQLDKLSLIINEYEIQPDMDIFCKGEIGSSFFILDEGEIKIYDDDPQKNITIKDEYNFGEICLGSNENIRRTYNIITITKTRLFILDIDKFNEFLEKQNINIKTLDITYLLNIDFFQDFHEEELNLLSKFCFILKEKDLKKNKNGQARLNALPPSVFLTINAAYTSMPQWSFGFKVGTVRVVGWYFSMMTNFLYKGAFSPFEENGHYVLTGNSKSTCLGGELGLVVRPIRLLSLHVGAGFGYRALTFESDRGWHNFAKRNYYGPTASAGIMFHVKGVVISAEATGMVYNLNQRNETRAAAGWRMGVGFCIPYHNDVK